MIFEVTTWFWISNLILVLKSPTFGYVAFLLLIYRHKIYYFSSNLVKSKGLASGSSLKEIMSSLSPVDYVSAAIGGAMAASGITLAGSVVANAALGGTTYLANCSYKGVKANAGDFVASTVIGGVAGRVGGAGANGKQMRGVYRRSKQVINATKSARKKAMYTAKITAVKKKVVKSVRKTVRAGLFSNVGNWFRKLLSKSKT